MRIRNMIGFVFLVISLLIGNAYATVIANSNVVPVDLYFPSFVSSGDILRIAINDSSKYTVGELIQVNINNQNFTVRVDSTGKAFELPVGKLKIPAFGVLELSYNKKIVGYVGRSQSGSGAIRSYYKSDIYLTKTDDGKYQIRVQDNAQVGSVKVRINSNKTIDAEVLESSAGKELKFAVADEDRCSPCLLSDARLNSDIAKIYISDEKFYNLLYVSDEPFYSGLELYNRLYNISEQQSFGPQVSELFKKINVELGGQRLPGTGVVCGKWISTLSKVDSRLAVLFDRRSQIYGTGGVNPTSTLFPNIQSKFNDTGFTLPINKLQKDQSNYRQLFKANWSPSIDQVNNVNSVVHIIDTASNKMDNFKYSTFERQNGQIIQNFITGHGKKIGEIITMINRNIELDFNSACNLTNCALIQVINSICDISKTASEDMDKRHVINLSLGSPARGTLLELALQNALSHQVLVAISGGNTDMCDNLEKQKIKKCYQYPIDQIAVDGPKVWRGVYVVGASYDGRPVGFNRLNHPNTPTGVKAPDVYAPGVFYFKDEKNIFNMIPGTSFSTGVVSAALAIWQSCNKETAPDINDLYSSSVTKLLDFDHIIKNCSK